MKLRNFIHVFAFLFFLLVQTLSFSQNRSKIDSIIRQLTDEKITDDSILFRRLLDLASEYTNTSPDTALDYAKKAFDFATKRKSQKQLSDSYHTFGNIYFFRGNYSEALNNYLLAMKIREKIHDKKGIAASYNNIGNVYREMKQYDKALDFYSKDYELTNELGDEMSSAQTLGNIGVIYDNKGEYDKALEYFFKGVKISEKLHDQSATANAYINIGLAYQEKNEPEKSLENYSIAEKITLESNNKEGLGLVYINTASCLLDKKDFPNAEKYLIKSVALSKEISSKNYLMYSYSYLSNLYFNKLDYKKAYEYAQLHLQVKDSIFNETSSKQITEMQTKYETEKKEQQITLLNKDKELQRIILWSVVAGLFFVVVCAGFIFRTLRITQKQKKVIEEQKIVVEYQKQIVDEKQKEILDSIHYAARIQRCILPTEKYIAQNISRLKAKRKRI